MKNTAWAVFIQSTVTFSLHKVLSFAKSCAYRAVYAQGEHLFPMHKRPEKPMRLQKTRAGCCESQGEEKPLLKNLPFPCISLAFVLVESYCSKTV